jgi:predicted secreted hydrolase
MKKTAAVVLLVGGLLTIAIHSACQKSEAFLYASKSYTLKFPADYAAHKNFKTEWWYYTGHLTADDGSQSFGYELTFFRTALTIDESGTTDAGGRKHIYFAHFGLTDETNKKFYFTEKQSRGAFGEADAAENFYKTYIGNWSVQELGNYFLVQAESDSLGLTLILNAAKPAILQGESGYSRKGTDERNASMYFSYTRLNTVGAVMLNGKRFSVRGESWHDHEFGTSQLDKNVLGWDWFSLQFADSTELMLYSLRQTDGKNSPYSSGTAIARDAKTTRLAPNDFTIEPLETYTSAKSGATYPSRWKITVPSLDISVEVSPTVQDQELITKETARINYWEGSVRVSGSKNKQPISGRGYVELTGYAKPMTAF